MRRGPSGVISFPGAGKPRPLGEERQAPAPQRAARAAAGAPAAPAAAAGGRRTRHGDPDLHPSPDGLMRRRYLAAAVVALAFALGGRQLWFRNHPLPSVATAVPAADSAPQGHRVPRYAAPRRDAGAPLRAPWAERRRGAHLASMLDLRKLKAGTRVSRAPPHADSAPDQISVRTGPEQRLKLTRMSAQWLATAEPIRWYVDTVRYAGAIESSLYEALDRAVPWSSLAGGRAHQARVGTGRRVRVAARLQPRPAAGRQVPGGARAADVGGGRDAGR